MQRCSCRDGIVFPRGLRGGCGFAETGDLQGKRSEGGGYTGSPVDKRRERVATAMLLIEICT